MISFRNLKNVLFTISLLSVSLMTVQCSQNQPADATHESPDSVRLQDQSILATLYVQHAAEYHALCLQTYRTAQHRLDELLSAGPIEKPAVVLDLDETVLDNSRYAAWQIQENKHYTPETWKQWTDLAEADSVPGSLGFTKYADRKGVSVFYVSNRKANELEATMKNMEQLGYPQVQSDHFFLKTTTSSKIGRRDSIRQQGYNVLLLFGDNLGDLADAFEYLTMKDRNQLTDSLRHRFGKDYFVLPNPTYGDWEGALYDYDYARPDSQLDSIRRSYLKGF